MNATANLHIHTTHSDGGNTPAEVICLLKEAGVTAFAITDHDTVDGSREAAAFAGEYGLTSINGIELSCCFADGEIGLDESWVMHILGLGINLDLMKDQLVKLQAQKHDTLQQLYHLLIADGYDRIALTNIAQGGKILSRKAIARELIDKGYAADRNECYAKILNTERYRPFAKHKPTIKEGIEMIHACGGLAVWAHPFGVTRGGKKELSQDQVSELLKYMRLYDIDGMEVYYQNYTPEQIKWLDYIAEDSRWYKTVGTDYHNSQVDDAEYPEYAEARKRERIRFDVVVPDAGVEATLRKLTATDDETSYPNKNFFTYKRYRFKCRKCDWEGLGSETIDVGDAINYEVIGCPKCENLIEFIDYPFDNDVLKFGTKADKERTRMRMAKDAAIQAEWDDFDVAYPHLVSPDQLPEIEADEIIISLREEGDPRRIFNHEFIVLYWGDRELWREPISFEYYTRYLWIGEILKKKYGERLIDFEAEHTVDLGGDSLSAFDKVDNFRKSLKRINSMLGWSILVSATGERAYGLVTWQTSCRSTEWMDGLVSQGKATHIPDGRCFHTYHIKAKDILPLVCDDESIEKHIGPIGYGEGPRLWDMRDEVWRAEAFPACTAPDEMLCIELWDMREL